MGYILTLIYVALSLLSPQILGETAQNFHVPLIIAIIIILASIPRLGEMSADRFPEVYLVLVLLFSSLISSGLAWIVEVPDTFNLLIPVLFSFYFIYLHCNTLERLVWVPRLMVVVALFILFQGVMAIRAGDENNTYIITEYVQGNHLMRIRGLGVINDPNDLAQIFVALIPLLWLWWRKGRAFWNFLLVLVPAGLLAWGIYLTHSRGAIIALVAIILLGFKDKLGVVKSLVLTAILATAMLGLNMSGGRGMDEDDGGRVALWSAGLTLFKTHPLFGVGMNNFANFTDHGVTAHNTYVLCMAEEGLVGYFFWMSLIVIGWVTMSRIIKEDKIRNKVVVPDEDLMPHLRGAKGAASQPSSYPAFGAAMQVAPGMAMHASTPALQFAGPQIANQMISPQMSQFGGGFGRTEEPEVDTTGQLVHAATMLRVSLIGMLTAAFFLSRAYVMTLYILLGMASVVRMRYREKYPESPFNVKDMMKRNVYITVGSITGIYLFVRFHGLH